MPSLDKRSVKIKKDESLPNYSPYEFRRYKNLNFTNDTPLTYNKGGEFSKNFGLTENMIDFPGKVFF